MTVWLRGDHLVRRSGPVARQSDEPVLLIGARSFAHKLPYHPHKLVLLFSAMRHSRDDLRADGWTVHYHQAESFRRGLTAHFETHPDDTLVTHRGNEELAAIRERATAIRELAEAGEL